MKKPVANYKEFRFSKLKDKEFSHLLLLLAWPVYFAFYIITENFISYDSCHVVHHQLDELFPFCEYFVVPYVLWFALVAGSLIYYLLYNTEHFKQLMTFIIVTQVVAMAIYIIYPNRQDLRPEFFERNNVFTKIVGFLYSIDTSTNVCPSLHVAYSIGIASVWLKDHDASVIWKIFIVLLTVSICLSTLFIKQHSVVDTFVAIPVCILAEIIAFGKTYWFPKFRKKT